MAYTKNTWNNGDVITAEKLNHMEDGIADSGGGSAFIINIIEDEATWTLDKTWQQIYEAFYSGSECVVKYERGENGQSLYKVDHITNEFGSYNVGFFSNQLSSNSPDGYPSVSFE